MRIFLAEKRIDIPLQQIDMSQGEHKSPDFLAKNPSGKIPVLELDDGTCIAESMAICRYFEAIQLEPPLFGTTPEQIGRIDMVNRQLEFELLGSVGQAWRNGPIVARMAPGRFEQIPAAKTQGEKATRAFYRRLDRELASRPFMAANHFSVADISALCIIDFASRLVDLAPDAEHTHIWRWHGEISARPSAGA